MLQIDGALAWTERPAAPLDRPLADWRALSQRDPALRFDRPAVGTVYGVLVNHVDALVQNLAA